MSVCPFDQQLSAYHDGELAATARETIDRHLRECAACVAQLERLAAMSGLFASEFRDELSPFSMRRLHRHVELAMERGVRRLAWTMSGLAASVLVAGSISLTGMHREPLEAPPPWVDVTAVAALPDA